MACHTKAVAVDNQASYVLAHAIAKWQSIVGRSEASMRQSDSPSARVSTVRPSAASERSAGDGGRWEEEGVGRRINDHYSTRMNSKAVAVLVSHPPPQRNHRTPVTNFKSSRAFYASYLSLFSQSLFSSTPENPLFGEEKSASSLSLLFLIYLYDAVAHCESPLVKLHCLTYFSVQSEAARRLRQIGMK